MKKLMLIGVALAALVAPATAADLRPRPAPVYKAPVPAPVFSWTGCFIGGHIGGGWGYKDFELANFGTDLGSHTIDGIVGGAQVGCDYQAGPWVIGVQGMFSWSDLDGSNVRPPAGPLVNHTHVPWMTTVTGRIGYTITPATLLYVRGGGAWTRDEFAVTTLAGGAVASVNVERTGWTVGVGIEQSFASYFSVFAEYNYLDFWKHNTTFSNGTVLNINQDVHLLTVGFNLRFSPFSLSR